MTPGSRLRCLPCRNTHPAHFIEDELAGEPPGAPTESSGFLLTSLAPSRSPPPGLAPAVSAFAPLVTTPDPAPTEDLFKQFMHAYMEDRQNPAPAPIPAPLAES